MSTLVDVFRGAAYIHDMSVVHLDLKPSNILPTYKCGRMVASVADFGLARAVPSDVAGPDASWMARCWASGPVQTAGYRAPEVVIALTYATCPCSSSMDVWSLGSIALHVLTSVRIHVDSDGRAYQLRVYAQLLGPCPAGVPWRTSRLYSEISRASVDPAAVALLEGRGEDTALFASSHAALDS